MELIKYLPEYMGKIKEINVIAKAEDNVFEKLDVDIDNLQKELFTDSASEIGIERFEKILGINNVGDDIEYRRFKIIVKLKGNDKISIKDRLDSIVGNENYKISLDIDNMCLEVKLTVKSERYLDTVRELLDRIVPCNLVLKVGILYASHKMIGKYKHSYLKNYKNCDIKLIGVES